MTTHYDCAMCGKPVVGRRWIKLNRYAIGSSHGCRITEVMNDDGEYFFDPAERLMSGTTLCWPECLLLWIEGAMTETDVLARPDKS